VRRGAAFFDDFYRDVLSRDAWGSAVDDDLCGFAVEDIAADIAPLRGLASIETLLRTLSADADDDEGGEDGGAKGAAAAAAPAGPVCEASTELEAKLRAAMPNENLFMVPAFPKITALRLLTTISGIGGNAAAAQLNGDPYFEAENRYQGLQEYAKARRMRSTAGAAHSRAAPASASAFRAFSLNPATLPSSH
jgi:hypothetical protein